MREMRRLVFCDVDAITREFLQNHEILDVASCEIISERLNDLSHASLQQMKDTEIISTFVYSRLTEDILKNFNNLRLITTRSTGYNNIDLDYCRQNNIAVANVVGYGAITVAEYAMGLLLNLAKNIGFSNKKFRDNRVDVEEDRGIDLHGKTIGVIGTGAIGQHFIKLCHAFGCDVIVSDPRPDEQLTASGLCRYVDLPYLLQSSDAISLHCPATTNNHHIINANTIAQMKDGVLIINTARGELIDVIALYDALLSGKVRGAGLDVLDYEDIMIKNDMETLKKCDKDIAICSMFNAKLIQLPNVIVTPHIAFNSHDAVLRILHSNLKTISDFIAGKNIHSVL